MKKYNSLNNTWNSESTIEYKCELKSVEKQRLNQELLEKLKENKDDWYYDSYFKYNTIVEKDKKQELPEIKKEEIKEEFKQNEIIPTGYRLLNENEIILENDLRYRVGLGKWVSISIDNIGEPYSYLWMSYVVRRIIIKECTEEQKQEAINKLTLSRAFNADSALKVNGETLEICLFMFDKELIGSIDGNKFYIKK